MNLLSLFQRFSDKLCRRYIGCASKRTNITANINKLSTIHYTFVKLCYLYLSLEMSVVKNSAIFFFLRLWVSEYVSEEQKKALCREKVPMSEPCHLSCQHYCSLFLGSFITIIELKRTNERRRQHKVSKKFAHFFSNYQSSFFTTLRIFSSFCLLFHLMNFFPICFELACT